MVKIVFYVTSCAHTLKSRTDITKIRHILDAKRVKYEEVDLSMDPHRRAEMLTNSGNLGSLPQLHIDGKYIGGADECQELEDWGELDFLLRGEPVPEFDGPKNTHVSFLRSIHPRGTPPLEESEEELEEECEESSDEESEGESSEESSGEGCDEEGAEVSRGASEEESEPVSEERSEGGSFASEEEAQERTSEAGESEEGSQSSQAGDSCPALDHSAAESVPEADQRQGREEAAGVVPVQPGAPQEQQALEGQGVKSKAEQAARAEEAPGKEPSGQAPNPGTAQQEGSAAKGPEAPVGEGDQEQASAAGLVGVLGVAAAASLTTAHAVPATAAGSAQRTGSAVTRQGCVAGNAAAGAPPSTGRIPPEDGRVHVSTPQRIQHLPSCQAERHPLEPEANAGEEAVEAEAPGWQCTLPKAGSSDAPGEHSSPGAAAARSAPRQGAAGQEGPPEGPQARVTDEGLVLPAESAPFSWPLAGGESSEGSVFSTPEKPGRAQGAGVRGSRGDEEREEGGWVLCEKPQQPHPLRGTGAGPGSGPGQKGSPSSLGERLAAHLEQLALQQLSPRADRLL